MYARGVLAILLHVSLPILFRAIVLLSASNLTVPTIHHHVRKKFPKLEMHYSINALPLVEWRNQIHT